MCVYLLNKYLTPWAKGDGITKRDVVGCALKGLELDRTTHLEFFTKGNLVFFNIP